MKGRVTLFLLALMMLSCGKEDVYRGRDIDYEYGRDLRHGAIVLGDRLDNPYKTENMSKALFSLYPTAFNAARSPLVSYIVIFISNR